MTVYLLIRHDKFTPVMYMYTTFVHILIIINLALHMYVHLLYMNYGLPAG